MAAAGEECGALLESEAAEKSKTTPPTQQQRLARLLPPAKLALLATFYAAYCLAIFSSSAFEVSVPAALEDAALGLTAEDVALALAAGQVATVTGKLFCGFVVDARGASSAFWEALLLMSALMLAGVGALKLGFHSGALLSFFAYKLAKSAVWPCMCKAAKGAFDDQVFGRVWGVLVTSSRVGAVGGGLVLSPLVMLGWVWPALVVAAGLVAIAVLLRFQTVGDGGKDGDTAEPGVSMREAVRVYGADRQLALIVGSEGMLLAAMDTSSLLPLFLHQQHGAGFDEAARLASLFPLGMVVAVATSGVAFDVLSPMRRALMLLVLGIGSAGSFALLAASSGGSMWTAGVLLFLGGGCFAPAKYLAPTIYVLENVSDQHSGKVLALMDVPGYFISAVFFKVYPSVVSACGWPAVWRIISGMILVSTACIVQQQRLEAGPKHNKRSCRTA